MVEWKKIKDICKTITPPTKIATNCYSACGNYPIIDQGQKDIVGYTDNELALLDDNKYILFGDHTRFVKYYEGRFAQGADGLKILITRDGVENKYFFYAFSNIEIPTRGYSRHWSIAKELEIPIPSKEEQTRIVGILDTFTDSIANLKAQIDARRKQYEYYRDQLLDLEGKEGVEMKTLKDIAVIMNGRDYKQLSEGDIPVYGTGGIMTYVDTYAYDKPSVLLPRKGSVEKIYYVTTPFWTVDTIYWTKINTVKILPKYLYLTLCKYDLRDLSYGGGIPSLSQKILYKLEIPLPSKEEQTRIVNILDQFEASIASLDALLKEREKQYEYYRNKLLTFE